ncbi:Hypothetical predicted protein [Lecanosticta acicola]|uniref:Uncharacterized protein n=1 Tax=Lecanosticta acicola TaxID=111012 RepID=A0AAI8Z5L9_9PEZI|nr:Hypothetical predicted protein [Lecanosticta acicola]
MPPNGTELTCRGVIDAAAPNSFEKMAAHFTAAQQALEAVKKGQVSFGTKFSVVDAARKFAGWLGNLDLNPTRRVFLLEDPKHGQLKPITERIWAPLIALRNEYLESQHSDDDQTLIESNCLPLRVEQALNATCDAINKIPGEGETCVCNQHADRPLLEGWEAFTARQD